MKRLLLFCGLLASALTIDCSTVASSATNRNLFAADIFKAVAESKLSDNVVISPAAIQTSLALAYYGAQGKTATELQTGLRLGAGNAEEVARQFGDYQKSVTRNNNIRLANNIYINENLEFKGKFREFAQRNFDSNVEKADFHPPYNKRTAEQMNRVVETKTNGKVTDVIKAQQMNDLTEGVIVNGIAYEAPWLNAFRADKTTKRTFSTGGRTSFQVDCMWTLNNFKYGEFSNLDAKVIELPYQNTEFSMLLLLPNKEDGLRDLEQRLAGKDVVALVSSGLSEQKVEVHLPKFSAAFGVNLEDPLKRLGISTMFTREGDFGNLYRMFVSHYINSADHKAYVAVSEAGQNPPLESGGLKSLFSRNKKFDVNHPFVFVVKMGDSIIFMGHIATYAYV